MLTGIQREVMAVIASRRTASSYMAGGAVLNRDAPRLSDDLDIFHDTDEEIVATARADIEALRSAGFKVDEDVVIYGVVECTVSRGGQATLIQWMSETRIRFLPLVNDDAAWGVRLSSADLAINKVLAASTRTQARDFVDLASIAETYAPLGPLVLAASGKPPSFSPLRIVEEIRRRANSLGAEDLLSVRGGPETSAEEFRERLEQALQSAEAYLRTVPPMLVGSLALDADGVPAEVTPENQADLKLLRPVDGGEVTPAFPDNVPDIRR